MSQNADPKQDFLDAELISQASQALNAETWVIQVFVVLLATGIINIIQARILRRLHDVANRTKTPWDEALIYSVQRPLTLILWVLGISFSCRIIGEETGTTLFQAVPAIRDVLIIALIAMTLTRLIKRAEYNLIQSKQAQGKSFDKTTLEAVTKLLRLTVFITSGLVALQTLGFSVSGVLAFGGIGGMAVGFAAKDMLANFFGGLTIYLDRPFTEGDWIRSPDRNIEGVVERIGWRQTVIRTFDKRPLYVPNASFSSIAVENPSRMHNRRIYETLGIRYDDADKMREITEEVRYMLRSHPEIDTNQTLIVNFNQFASSSLDFFIYCFTKTTDWVTYHQIKEDVLLKVMDIILQKGAECAFPTSTIYLSQNNPEDPAFDPSALAGGSGAVSHSLSERQAPTPGSSVDSGSR
ncbi:mechanosensitive ion channel family protein [Oceanospirillum linum]|uniref:Mechanosensitive ion channel protein MscS n=1 Tax=Oceanospirillum linum TaxID=966 RepID=A0A1T1HAU9_OCELI|nr:mechanosensitive ion channel family protein [Oceanospirillum linum]OOV86857.1 mechanosensitive ion channel protein MscS [Oceanospirillum linum]SEG20667.1 MscS family membrane protein [Oleiphilus messinensis]SMP24672.1 MscS family membrane protein [Oceanospirillum linum]